MPLEDYITEVFCLIDDLYYQKFGSNSVRKAGFAPLLKDSEIITMLLVGEFLGLSENSKIWLYFKSSHYDLFPLIKHVKYKVFNKHATNLWHIVHILHQQLLQNIGQWEVLLADGVPIPTCHLARSNRSKLFADKTAKHFCAAKQEHYHGFKLLLVTSASGIPITYNLAPANVDERELLLNSNVPANTTVIADKGFIGKNIAHTLKEAANITLLTPLRKNMLPQLPKSLSKLISKTRKRIETTISQLTESFTINSTKARSYHGLLGRINRKILSYTVALFFNFQIVKDRFTQLELLINS